MIFCSDGFPKNMPEQKEPKCVIKTPWLRSLDEHLQGHFLGRKVATFLWLQNVLLFQHPEKRFCSYQIWVKELVHESWFCWRTVGFSRKNHQMSRLPLQSR